jgi:hypothetical protein
MKDIYLHDFTDQEHEDIRLAAIADGRTIHSWCKMALRSQSKGIAADMMAVQHMDRLMQITKGTKPITTTLLPGQDLIVQNRSSNGKFAKRSK